MSGSFAYGKSKSSTDPAYAPQTQALSQEQIALTRLGLSILQDFKSELPGEFASLQKELDIFKKASDEIAGDINIDAGQVLAKIATEEYKLATTDPKTSAEDIELIRKIADSQISSLHADVATQFKNALGAIKSEFSGRRGLRHDTDSPVGSAAGAQGARLIDSLARETGKIRSTQFQNELTFGLQKAQTRSGILGQARQGALDIVGFKRGLAEDALSKQSEFLSLKSGILSNLGAVATGGTATAISGLARAFSSRGKSLNLAGSGSFGPSSG